MFHFILCVKFATVCMYMCVCVWVYNALCSICTCVHFVHYIHCKFVENWNAQTIAQAMQLTHLVIVRYLYALHRILWVYWTDLHILNMCWKRTAANSYWDVKIRYTFAQQHTTKVIPWRRALFSSLFLLMYTCFEMNPQTHRDVYSNTFTHGHSHDHQLIATRCFSTPSYIHIYVY